MTTNDVWGRAVLLRGVVIGAALAMAAAGGITVVQSQSPAGISASAVLLATVMVAFSIGLWAGATTDDVEQPKMRERWLSAGAIAAGAGAYASFSALYQQVYPGPYWAIGSLLITVAVPAYTVGLIPPSVLAWGFRGTQDSDEGGDFDELRLARWLITSMTAGAALGLLLAFLLILPMLSPGTCLILAAALLIAPLSLADPAEGRPREAVIAETVTPFASLRVSEVTFAGDRQPERRLYLNDEEESGELVRSGAPTLAYIAAAEAFLATNTPAGASYLFLGGGAYTLPRRMAERDGTARITVVELDPEITRIAYGYFGVAAHHRIGSVHGDARAYVEAMSEPRFDRIYIDIYSGEESLPYSIVTREAAEAVRARLNPGGILGMNVIGNATGPQASQPWSVVTTYAEVFPRVAVYSHLGPDFPDRQNLLLVATVDGAGEFPLSAGTFDLWPADDWPRPETLMTFRDLYSGEEDNQLAQRAYASTRARDRRP